MITRLLQTVLEKRLFKGKAILLFGARQTGKSTLAEAVLANQHQDRILLNGDDADVRETLTNTTASRIKSIIGKNKLVIIDEA